jgi:5-methylcytosine-specific restriction endonuclease McrA
LKRCRACNELKPITDFSFDRRASDGLQSRCKKCKNEWIRAYRLRTGITKTTRSDDSKTRRPGYGAEAQRLYRQRHPDRARQINAKWRAENKEHHSEYNATWRADHPEHHTKLTRRYVQRKRQNGGHFTKQEFVELCAFYGNKCLRCGSPGPLVSDHIIPVSKGGSSNIDNIQPLCVSCNSKKRDKIIDYRKVV